MSNRTSSRVVGRQQQSNDDDRDAASDCCMIRIGFCFVIVISEIVLISVGYTWTPFQLLIWLLLLVPRGGRVAMGDPAPGPAIQLVPTDDPDLEAPMAVAEVVSVDHVHNVAASAIDTLEEEELRPSGQKPLPADFRQAVTVASMETTEVNIRSWEKAIATDPLNGCYDIQFESQDDSSIVTHKTMELTFSRGFCGWNIHGTRRKHKNDDDDDEEDGLFSIQRGFLAQSGKMYWEERRELKPSYSVLVVGMLDADMTGTFHGEWLSSQKGATTGRVRARGRFRKFVRRDDNGQHENVIV
jgi:hypothetical protein